MLKVERQLTTERDPEVRAQLEDKAKGLQQTLDSNREAYDKWKDGGAHKAAADVLIAAAGGGTVTATGAAVTRESLAWAATQMREAMIEDSKKFPGIRDAEGNVLDNKSGVSVGVNGDEFKLAGGRVDIEEVCKKGCRRDVSGELLRDELGYVMLNDDENLRDLIETNPDWRSPLGGFQGGVGKFMGLGDYEKGSLPDILAEAYAGTHDTLNSDRWYGPDGIKAGDGGFDVKVQGDTTLKGGVIESTQVALDNNRNRFETGGELSLSDLENRSWSNASSYAVSGSVGFMAGGAQSQQQAMKDRGLTDEQIAVASNTKPGGGAGVGSAGSSQTSTTKSGISGIAGDESVRTGDDSSAGTLVKEWNTQALVKDVQAQAQITAEFGQRASSAWGEYANGKLVDALVNEDKEAAACWGDGGACRAAGHTAIGGLAGGAAGAAGAASGAPVVSKIGEAVTNLGLSGPAADAVVAGLALSLGSAVGGASGAAGAFNEATNNYLTSGQVRDMMGKLREAKTQQERDKILDEYAALSAKQSASIKGCEPAACEAIAADVRDGKKALDSASIELNRLAGDSASGKAVGQIQNEDNRHLFSIGSGWIDSHGNLIDRSQEMRQGAKDMADSVATAAAYGAAGCALTVVCSPAIPAFNAVGAGAAVAGSLIFDQNPTRYLADWGVDSIMRRLGTTLKIPLSVTIPLAEGIKGSNELEDLKQKGGLTQ